MTLNEAKDIAQRVANFNSTIVTNDEKRQALAVLANFAEDIMFTIKEFNRNPKAE